MPDMASSDISIPPRPEGDLAGELPLVLVSLYQKKRLHHEKRLHHNRFTRPIDEIHIDDPGMLFDTGSEFVLR
jgi:hypothetical protein